MSSGKSGTAARSNVIVTTIAALLAAANPAFAEESHNFHIAVADASSAVREFANQSGVQIMASADALKNKQLNPVVGEHTTEDALTILLTNTGLEHRYVGERGVVIAPSKLRVAQRGILRGGRDASLGLQYIVTYIQPRTAGLTVSRSF